MIRLIYNVTTKIAGGKVTHEARSSSVKLVTKFSRNPQPHHKEGETEMWNKNMSSNRQENLTMSTIQTIWKQFNRVKTSY